MQISIDFFLFVRDSILTISKHKFLHQEVSYITGQILKGSAIPQPFDNPFGLFHIRITERGFQVKSSQKIIDKV